MWQRKSHGKFVGNVLFDLIGGSGNQAFGFKPPLWIGRNDYVWTNGCCCFMWFVYPRLDPRKKVGMFLPIEMQATWNCQSVVDLISGRWIVDLVNGSGLWIFYF